MTLGNKSYQVEYLVFAVKEDSPLFSKRIKTTIKKAIEERLMLDPIGFGKPLRYSLSEHRRLHVGDYRFVYRIDSDKNVVLIIASKHRRDAYEE